MVHCHWEYDLRTSIQIADAGRVEPASLARGSADGGFLGIVGAVVR